MSMQRWGANGQTGTREMSRWIRGACFAGYYWMTGRRSLLSLVNHLDDLHLAPRSEIDIQVRRDLLDTLTHAVRSTPYYRDLVNSETLSEATAIPFLQKMPILTKDIIRREGRRLISEQPEGKARWNASGGSTGEPIRLLQDRQMTSVGRAGELLYMRWAGHRMGEPHMFIWCVPEVAFGQKVSLHDRFYRLVHNEIYLNCYRITDDLLYSWVDCINAKRPALIEGYVDAVWELSRLIIKRRISVAKPKGIITGAGVMTPEMRDVIEQAFGCQVLNRYGSREVGNVACSCECNAELHVNEATCYLEIVDDDGKSCDAGVEGNILVTLFRSHGMPLIRYQIEDRGVWATGTCPCGRTARRLAGVNGRQFDFLLAADGTKMHAATLVYALFSVSTIRRYQFRQISRSHVILNVVPATGCDTEAMKQDMELPLKKVRSLLPGVSVELALVDEIVPSKSGKLRYILNCCIGR